MSHHLVESQVGTDNSVYYLQIIVCSVTWPMNASEAGRGLALIKTSLLF